MFFFLHVFPFKERKPIIIQLKSPRLTPAPIASNSGFETGEGDEYETMVMSMNEAMKQVGAVKLNGKSYRI